MSFRDLRSFIQHLESIGKLVRVTAEVDANQELAIIQHRVLAEKGPALLFENIKGSRYRIVSNLFGTKDRVDMVFGQTPEELGAGLLQISERIMPPSLGKLWKMKKGLWEILRARLRDVATGPVLETVSEPADLNKIPVLTCWPKDGGPFFTLPLIHTVDPVDGRGNLGIYRLQRFDAVTTGMHWQIEKGGGFHFHRAVELGRPLPVSAILGGPPALIIAAVAPLPEGIDERLLASYIMGRPLDLILRKDTGHRIPAYAEFVLEGSVTNGDIQQEGPFGDHLGHYSHMSDFPLFRVKKVLARKDAIYPATVVGKPIQEDFYIGIALQEMTRPIIKILRPAISDFRAYPETGFHPLAVMSVKERYPHEALKHTLSMLGEGQASLTKVLIAVDSHVQVQDFNAVSSALWRHLDTENGIHLLAPTAQDTLDFTGPAINQGSRLILIATQGKGKPIRTEEPPPPPAPQEVDAGIDAMVAWGPSFLMVRLKDEANVNKARKALQRHPVTSKYLFPILLSSDVPLDDKTMMLWGWFTRFDPLRDLHPAGRVVRGNRLVFDFPIVIDARWKEGYPRPVAFDPALEKRVDQKWKEYNLP